MENYLFSLFEITVTMAAVILLLMLLSVFFGHRYKARTRYIVWMIVLARLCIPFGVSLFPAVIEVEIPAQVTEPEPIVTEPDVPELLPDIPVYTVPDHVTVHPSGISPSLPVTQPEFNDFPAVETFYEKESPLPEAPSTDEILHLIARIWLCGAVSFFLWRIIGYTLVSYKLRRHICPANEETEKLYHLLAEKMNIRHVPPLCLSRDVHSPMLCGYFRPVIILPELALSSDSAAGILAHELTHYRRGDLWVKLVCVLACSVHWFNPLVHLAASRCNREMELSCDESVLTGLDDAARVSYGKVMLEIIKSCRSTSTSMTTHFNPRKSAVLERFQGILDSTVKKRGVWIIVLVLALCILAGTWIAYSFAENPENDENTSETSEAYASSDSTETDNTVSLEPVRDTVEVEYKAYTPLETYETTHAAIPDTEIAEILTELTVDGVRILLFSAPEGGLCAAYEKDGAYIRFLILAYPDAAMPTYLLAKFENILSSDGFSISWNWAHDMKYYYTIDNGEPKLLLDASDEITEADCDRDGMAEVICETSGSLTVYDCVNGGVVTVDLLPDILSTRRSYYSNGNYFRFKYERIPGEGLLYPASGELYGNMLNIIVTDHSWYSTAKAGSAAVYYLNNVLGSDGISRVLRLDYNGEQIVFLADFKHTMKITFWDYTLDGIDDCMLSFCNSSGDNEYLLYDTAVGGSIYEPDSALLSDIHGIVQNAAVDENTGYRLIMKDHSGHASLYNDTNDPSRFMISLNGHEASISSSAGASLYQTIPPRLYYRDVTGDSVRDAIVIFTTSYDADLMTEDAFVLDGGNGNLYTLPAPCYAIEDRIVTDEYNVEWLVMDDGHKLWLYEPDYRNDYSYSLISDGMHAIFEATLRIHFADKKYETGRNLTIHIDYTFSGTDFVHKSVSYYKNTPEYTNPAENPSDTQNMPDNTIWFIGYEFTTTALYLDENNIPHFTTEYGTENAWEAGLPDYTELGWDSPIYWQDTKLVQSKLTDNILSVWFTVDYNGLRTYRMDFVSENHYAETPPITVIQTRLSFYKVTDCTDSVLENMTAVPEDAFWHTLYDGEILALLYDEDYNSHLVYAPGTVLEYEITVPALTANDVPNPMQWSSTDLIEAIPDENGLTLWLNQYNYRYFRVSFVLHDSRLEFDFSEHIDTASMLENTWISEGEIILNDYRDLLPYAEAGFINAYDFFHNLLSGESEIEEYNTVIIEDYTLRFTIPLTDYKIYFDYTVKESGLESMPVGTYHKVVEDIVDKYLVDVEKVKSPDPYADVKEVDMLKVFFGAGGLWRTPTFGEGTTYPGMHNFICNYYGDSRTIISLEEYKRLAEEKFGVKDFDALGIDVFIMEDGTVQEGSLGGSSCYEILDVQTKDGMVTITVQFYADCNALLKSHKVAYLIGEDETWHGYEILEQSKYDPFGLSNIYGS